MTTINEATLPNRRLTAGTAVVPAPREYRRLARGTTVVSTDDAEPGRVVEVCTHRRNGIDAFSYVVETQYGREVWEVGELFVPGTN